MLGLGQLLRRVGVIGDGVDEILKNALSDSSEYERGHAWATAGDLEHFGGLSVRAEE